jgi:hypothetical protein
LSLKDAVEINIEEKNFSELPTTTEYALVKGYVEPMGNDVESNYKPGVRGVIRLTEIVAHGTNKSNNIS